MEFEEYNKELEDIIEKLSNGNVSLSEGVKLYERGVEISKICNDQLTKAKGKVAILRGDLEEIIG